MQYLYFVISRTPTGFGSVIRKLGKVKYNHASVALDPQLKKMFAFGRFQHNTLLLAWLMPEHMDRFTLRKYKHIDCTVFRIPVTEEQYLKVCNTITTIGNDTQYMYNYMSVILFPFFKGFETYKSYSCVEFVMHLLSDDLSFPTEKRLCSYTPDDLLTLLSQYVYYSGNLLDYYKESENIEVADNNTKTLCLKTAENTMITVDGRIAENYFGRMTFGMFLKSCGAIISIIVRTLSFKRKA